jgi:hypothetical protein
VLAVHQQVLPVHVHLDVVDPLRAQLVDHVQRHPQVPHQDLHRGLGVLVLEKQLHVVARADLGGLADAIDQPSPGVDVGRLERVVVALAAGPDDQVGTEGARELGGLEQDAAGLRAHALVGIRQPASAEARIQVQPARDAVDVVTRQRFADRLEVGGRELIRIVELVAVDQLPEAGDCAVHLLGHRLAVVRVLGLIATRDEPRDHRSERPDAEARLHRFWLRNRAAARRGLILFARR